MTRNRTGRLRAPFSLPALGLLASGLSAHAEAPRLGLPLDCDLGKTCYIQQYVDRDPGPDQRDIGCGELANDAHTGTDFAVPTLADMARGVPVIAAAPGIVRGVRDGMPDIDVTDPAAPDVTGRECGNGVAIRHGDGWETQYCHLREGSVAVHQGQRVARGAVLGLVGMSGEATFPHVHFSLRHGKAVIDPFNPAMDAPCGPAETPLWSDAPIYRPGGILQVGVLDRVPDYEEVKAGLPENALPETDPAALVVWGYAFAGEAGDAVEISLSTADGQHRRHSEPLPKRQPFFFRAWGIRAPEGGFEAGLYRGEVRLLRGKTVVDARAIVFDLR